MYGVFRSHTPFLHFSCTTAGFYWRRLRVILHELTILRSFALLGCIKEIFKVLLSINCILRLTYVLSTANIADYPSRSLSLADAHLSHDIWMQLQTAFGDSFGHTIDLMALPSIAMSDLSGNLLPFFSPYPSPGCRGVDIFSQMPHQYPPQLFNNPYVFPPICLIPHVLRFHRSTVASFTTVFPDIQPRRFWWPILENITTSIVYV